MKVSETTDYLNNNKDEHIEKELMMIVKRVAAQDPSIGEAFSAYLIPRLALQLGPLPLVVSQKEIKKTKDKKYLFVSSRGPNNRETYLKKGPKFGKIYVIDTEKMKIVDWVWGKNQPTGLDISPDGKYLAFSNFLDNEIEVYRINSK